MEGQMKTGVMRKLHKDSKGFTLIELMIVVAIIGILAAIAIPNFIRYQMKAKTAEAKTNIGAIRTSEEAFAAENDEYLGCVSTPAGNATATKTAWAVITAGSGFDAIGFAPAGNVYYRYGVVDSPTTTAATLTFNSATLTAYGADDAPGGGSAPAAGTVNIIVNAVGDLDGDSVAGAYSQTEEGTVITDLNPGQF
jgi:type IV pilus assembly protein PilA